MITANTLDRISAEAEARGADREGARIRRELLAEFGPNRRITNVLGRKRVLVAVLDRIIPETSASCAWTEDEDGVWATACGESFVFTDGGPVENRARFCPYCGRSLEVKAS